LPIHYDTFLGEGAPTKICGCLLFTGETANAKAKLSENFLSPDHIFGGFRGLGSGRPSTESFDFYSKGTSLPESASFKPFCVTIGWRVW